MCFTFISEQMVIGSVILLNLLRSENAIFWAIIAVYIHSLNSESVFVTVFQAPISERLITGIPFLADFDTSATVSRILLGVRIIATIPNA